MADMSIGQVARRAGIRPSALRYYESIGLLPTARRVGGRRRYGPDTLRRLAGFTLAEIRHLYYGFPRSARPAERWRELARKKLPEIEDLIRRATRMRRFLSEGIRCGCASLEECTLLAQRTRAAGPR